MGTALVKGREGRGDAGHPHNAADSPIKGRQKYGGHKSVIQVRVKPQRCVLNVHVDERQSLTSFFPVLPSMYSM